MTTDRGHASEDEYIRDQEAQQLRDQALAVQQVARTERAKRDDSEARRVRQAARAAESSPSARRAARRGLNRLIVAGCGEIVALDEAVGIMADPDRQSDLRQKADLRRVFQRDLSRAVVALGGVPAKGASLRARGLAWGRSLRRLVTGPHGGDAYAACALAAETASGQYSGVLRLSLSADLRLDVERQLVDVNLDWADLRRMRWGASPA
jgi:hypothetical protein